MHETRTCKTERCFSLFIAAYIVLVIDFEIVQHIASKIELIIVPKFLSKSVPKIVTEIIFMTRFDQI